MVCFIRLRRRPRALPVDECEKGFCFGEMFAEGQSPLGSLSADTPAKLQRENSASLKLRRNPSEALAKEGIGAKQGKTNGYHGLCPWGSIVG